MNPGAKVGNPRGREFRLRPMRDSDLSDVHAVECAGHRAPWNEEILRDCLGVGYCCWVGEIGGRIVAHGIMSVAVGECNIFNLCIHPDWQRQGLGRRLLRHLLALAVRRQADTAFLEVRASNAAARALYAAEGFTEIGIRRGYYPTGRGREDAVMLAAPLAHRTAETDPGARTDPPCAPEPVALSVAIPGARQ